MPPGARLILVGVDAASGMLLWEIPYVTQSTTNSLTPLMYGALHSNREMLLTLIKAAMIRSSSIVVHAPLLSRRAKRCASASSRESSVK
mgnify:CR=1 FL=1